MKSGILKFMSVAAIVLATYAPLARAQKAAALPTPQQAQAVLVVAVPEPSSRAILAVELAGVCGLIFLFRRRSANAER